MPSENKLGALISPSSRSFSRALGDWKISYITTNGHLEDCFSRVDKKRFQFLPNDDQQYEYRYVLHIYLFWQCYSYCVRMCKAESLQICRKKLENMVLKMGWIRVHTAKNHWPLNWLAFDFRQRQRQTQTQTQKTLGTVSWFCDYLDKVDDSWQIEKL